MLLFRTLHLHRSFSRKNPARIFSISNPSRSSPHYFSSAILQEIPTYERIPAIQDTETPPNTKKKKPLDLFFREAVGLLEKVEEGETSDDDERAKKLRDLERELKNLRPNATETQKKDGVGTVGATLNRLYSLFAEPPSSGEKLEGGVSCPKELSPEMVSFVGRLNEEGYLINGNFVKDGRLDLSCLSNSYSCDYLKFAAERFGQDHQESARQLSGSDLKEVTLFGCPSTERRTVFAAKSLRSFFCIREDIVCQPCKLKSLCKFANQRVKKRWNLDLKDALRVLAVYGLESLPQQLIVSDDIKVSVSKLLKAAVKLGK
ncbi:uncharacterized protein LOC131240945 [Magnolia sinica]|uniref:uncharacterized protein LOC131240945 n=1 Tax=Magnolia sinica TaxID=86752 RepID=UPI002659E063|nr:uncharacterized protein LOC131240945 [Magnolia sinica]XP_058095486.1 uncharacterized protein LOC131240945 [Magnolia sinica]XP_058095487.1 uncharacterized protein LOC131240945 [Magnolia sinica]